MNDLINRQAALDIFKSWLDVKGYSEGELNMLRAVIYELETMPSTSAWVSVKDRLPEKEGAYIVFKTNITHLFVAIWNGKEWNSFINHSTLKRITHWMPLPQKPKSESDAE